MEVLIFVVGLLVTHKLTVVAALGLYLLLVLFRVFTLWVAYVALMYLRNKKEDVGLSLWDKCLGFVLLWYGYFVDVSINWFESTFLFCEFPREATLSDRMRRLAATSPATRLGRYRKNLALWGLTELDWFDRHGAHSPKAD